MALYQFALSESFVDACFSAQKSHEGMLSWPVTYSYSSSDSSQILGAQFLQSLTITFIESAGDEE